ncbi:hypothetical protein FOZ63_029052 [Perkinsus olseni]|nr:hypothetical protein FOZ63_029052 [Perkinsus olseni]
MRLSDAFAVLSALLGVECLQSVLKGLMLLRGKLKLPQSIRDDKNFRAVFGSTVFNFEVGREDERSMHINVTIHSFPGETAIEWACEGAAKSAENGGKYVPCECVSVTEHRHAYLEAGIWIDRVGLGEASILIFDPHCGMRLCEIPYLIAEGSRAKSIPWMKPSIQDAEGFNKWAQCPQPRGLRGSDNPLNSTVCLVRVADGYPNPMEKALGNGEPLTAPLGFLVQYDMPANELLAGITDRKLPFEGSICEELEGFPSVHFPDAEALKSQECENVRAVFHVQRFSKDVLFLNSRSLRDGEIMERGCYCEAVQGEEIPRARYTCECRRRLSNAEHTASLETCFFHVHLMTSSFVCRDFTGKIDSGKLRVLHTIHPVEFQQTFPYGGLYKQGTVVYEVTLEMSSTETLLGFVLRIYGEQQMQMRCEWDHTVFLRGYRCTDTDSRYAGQVDFVYNAVDGLHLRHVAGEPGSHVIVARFIDEHDLFGSRVSALRLSAAAKML